MSKANDPKVSTQNFIKFNEYGAPFSTHFNDIYFDSQTGYQQSQQVFIEGNQFTERLSAYNKNNQPILTIAETGFGTGLNFILTLRAYHQSNRNHNDNTEKEYQATTLKFISVEKFPLTKLQLEKSLALFPELAFYTRLLIDQYPEQPNGICEFNFFDNQVNLQLIIDDACKGLTKLRKELKKNFNKKSNPKDSLVTVHKIRCEVKYKRNENFPLVDIWYLDGFSPEKNPEMWDPSLFQQIANLSKQQATLATFTVAGFVRRGLTEVGFRVQKQQTNGTKREISVGVFQNAAFGKGYQIRPKSVKPQQVTIIGGGIASACTAYALTKQGIKVVLYCKDNEIAQGASSNAIGALFPLIHQLPDDISHFYQQAFWRAKALYQEINQQGFNFSHDWCGLLDIAFDDKLKTFQQKFEQLKLWPHELITSVNAKTAANIADLPLKNGGLFYPNAGWIAPQELVQQIFNATIETGRLTIKCNINVEHISQRSNNSWQLSTNKGQLNAKVLLLCGGAEAIKLNVLQQSSLVAIRGQVSLMKPNKHTEKLKTVICHKGYLTPTHNNQQCIGATFERGTFNTEIKTVEDRYNLNMLEQCLPKISHWQLSDVITSKARLRCASPDHFPMVGAMPDVEQHKITYAHLAKDKNFNLHTPAPCLENLYMLTGLGARGLCSAPLLADILVADLCGTPYPINYKRLYNLAPNRFIIKDIVKNILPTRPMPVQ